MTIMKWRTRRLWTFVLVFAIAFVVILSNNTVYYADAGASKVYVVRSASVRGNVINGGDFMTEGNVKAENSKAVFNDSKVARLVAKTRIKNLKDYGVKTLFYMSATFVFNKLDNGGKAAFLFGLEEVDSAARSAGSGEVAFTYDGESIGIEVNEYVKKDKEPKPVFERKQYSMLPKNTSITLDMSVDVNGKIYATVSCEKFGYYNIKILDGVPLEIDPQGFVAFASLPAKINGDNYFSVYDMSVTAYAYDTVETVDYYKETFDSGSYNANMFYSQTTSSPIYPSKIAVEDGKLVFRNVGQGYFTTREKFSNFELKFDIIDLYREGVKDSAGNIVKLISNWFMIGFGVDNYNDPPSEHINATFLHFSGMPLDAHSNRSNHYSGEVTDTDTKDKYVLYNNGSGVDTKYMSGDINAGIFSLWDNGYIQDRTVNLKLTVVDGLITLYYKLESDEDYVKQYEYDLGTMQTGYVRIYSYGDGSGSVTEYTGVLNMTIDNFEITNLENDAVKRKVRPIFKSNVKPKTSDYLYTTVPDASDLLSNKLKSK